MIATLRNQPNFSELFMADLLSRNSRIEEDLIDQLFNSSEKRLARALLLLANFGKENGPAGARLRLFRRGAGTARRPGCSRATRPGASPPTSRNCQSYFIGYQINAHTGEVRGGSLLFRAIGCLVRYP